MKPTKRQPPHSESERGPRRDGLSEWSGSDLSSDLEDAPADGRSSEWSESENLGERAQDDRTDGSHESPSGLLRGVAFLLVALLNTSMVIMPMLFEPGRLVWLASHDATLPLFFGSIVVITVLSVMAGSWRQGYARVRASLSFVWTTFITVFAYAIVDIQHLDGPGLTLVAATGVALAATHGAPVNYWGAVLRKVGDVHIGVGLSDTVIKTFVEALTPESQLVNTLDERRVPLEITEQAQSERGSDSHLVTVSMQSARGPGVIVADCRSRVMEVVSASMSEHRARARLSLIIGLMFSIVGVPLAAWIFLAAEGGYQQDNTEIVLFYSSRVAFLAVVEILALFS